MTTKPETERKRKLRQRWRENGRCGCCGKERAIGSDYCQKCLDSSRNRPWPEQRAKVAEQAQTAACTSLVLRVPNEIAQGVTLRMLGTQKKPEFCFVDVLAILGYNDLGQAVRDWRNKLTDKDLNFQEDLLEIPRTGRGRPSEIHRYYLSRGGVFKVILKSGMPNAEPFADWVCYDVLESIAEHGCYPPPVDPPSYPSHGIIRSEDRIVPAGACCIRFRSSTFNIETVRLDGQLWFQASPMLRFLGLSKGSIDWRLEKVAECEKRKIHHCWYVTLRGMASHRHQLTCLGGFLPLKHPMKRKAILDQAGDYAAAFMPPCLPAPETPVIEAEIVHERPVYGLLEYKQMEAFSVTTETVEVVGYELIKEESDVDTELETLPPQAVRMPPLPEEWGVFSPGFGCY